jgi:hypothetical protein
MCWLANLCFRHHRSGSREGSNFVFGVANQAKGKAAEQVMNTDQAWLRRAVQFANMKKNSNKHVHSSYLIRVLKSSIPEKFTKK